MTDAQLASLTVQLRTFLAAVQRETNVPGIGVAVSVGGRRAFAQVGTLLAGDRAPLAIDARFQLGCITKLLLALTVLELAARGVLDLDAPLGEHVAELRGTPHGRAIRLRHLLAHTSGYRGTDVADPAARAFTWDGFIAHLRGSEPLFTPGTVFNHEHSEAALLAAVVARATGVDATTAIATVALEPRSIPPPIPAERCAADVRVVDHRYDGRLGRFVPDTAPAPHGFWRAAFSDDTLPLPDLLTLAETLVEPTGSRRPAVAALLERAVDLPPLVGGPLSELLPIGFGHGAAMLRDGWFGNTGVARGQCVGLRFGPERRVAVAVGINAFAPHLRDLILGAVCASVTGGAPSADDRPRAHIDLGALGGVYVGNGRRIVVARYRKGRLELAIGREGSPLELNASLLTDDDGRLVLATPAPQLAAGVGREPDTGEPFLMIGLNAFKRRAAAAG